MFYEYEAEAFDSGFISQGKVKCDLQPSDKVFTFEGNLQFDANLKVFMDKNQTVKQSGYMKIDLLLYKILDIKHWDDYMEVWLYECKNNF